MSLRSCVTQPLIKPLVACLATTSMLCFGLAVADNTSILPDEVSSLGALQGSAPIATQTSKTFNYKPILNEKSGKVRPAKTKKASTTKKRRVKHKQITRHRVRSVRHTPAAPISEHYQHYVHHLMKHAYHPAKIPSHRNYPHHRLNTKMHSHYHRHKLDGSVDNIVHYTLHSNPSVLAAKANQKALFHSYKQQVAGFFPSVDITYAWGREHSNSIAIQNVTGRRDGAWLNRLERRISVNQMIFDGWAVSSRSKSAHARYTASQFQTFAEETNLALRAIEADLDIMRFRELQWLAVKNKQLHRDTLEKVDNLYRGGAGNRADVELAKSRTSLAQSNLITANRSLYNAHAVFEAVVGKLSKNLVLRMPRLNMRYLPRTLDKAITIAYMHNPLVHVEHKLYAASKYDVTTAKSAFYPNVSLELSASRNNNLDGTVGINNDKQAMVVVSYNLFRGGADLHALRSARERAVEQHEKLQESFRTVRQNVTEAWVNLRAARSRLQQQELRAHNAAEVVNVYRKQFTLGKRSLLNLLDTERELFNARNDLVNGRYDVVRDTYRLYAAEGILLKPCDKGHV